MKATPLSLPEVLLIEPDVFGDPRGFFMETWSRERYAALGIDVPFVQDNLSRSSRGVLRGLHLQNPYPQAKLVWVPVGEVLDVVVDVRVGSPRFGQWASAVLSSENKRQLFVPSGFAHGFSVISDDVLFAYKCSERYHPETELGVAWNDPRLGIDWRVAKPSLSSKDSVYPPLAEIPVERLPRYGAA
ncbi:MAG TPA: dTDP-4-dehydrorhamnose 3,5-epimerase [Polyangia bacterium]|jgi:dTDP-4-dehydrorhamnose 3,5-epimerase|nr:dTDP-4-dehydrorhamnose 3,5-epimerase [Polyangia bacterium]